MSKPLMNPLDRKSSKTTIDPLINWKCRLNLIYMPAMRSVGIGLVSFFACTALGLAAADFKIRYNQKFPCLEVMDSSAVKITDVTEGAKGETVTSGKSSLNISFIKNSSGQPEVTMRDAKSPLSEMEIEAFGLSVGMKPEGTVLVRFGSDNKPKFEMDRTGGSRFLMADLGNLDTAAGKEVAGNTPPSKNLIRCRERLAEWISGKGGWSNKSGKILATQGGDRVQAGELPEREIQVSEAFQTGAKITVGSKNGLMFQSGAGVFHFALPGTVFSLGKLETGSPDLKVELSEGTIQTFVAQALTAPRVSLVALENGEVVRTLDGAYQISKTSGAESTTTITTISGKVILAREAGGKELATLSGEKIWSGTKGGEVKALAANSPEKASLLAFEGSVRNTALIDIARDGVKACPEAVEEIVSSAVKAKPELAKEIAEKCLAANPKFLNLISQASGVKGLKLSKEEQAKVDALESLDQRLERLAIDGIDLEMKLGQVLLVEGDCKLDGKKEKILVGQVLVLNDKIATGKSGRILVGLAPGVVLSVEPESVVSLEKMSAEIKNGELLNRAAVVNSESGLVVMNIAPWNKEKTDVRVKTTDGESVAQGTVFAVTVAGGKMMTTVTRGSVGSRDSSGKMVSIPAGQQAAPGATPAATPANSPAVTAAGKAVESTVSAMVANVAASVAAAIPTAAAEVAAIAAKASPAAAEQIAAAVAAKAPDAAIAIAQAVSKVAPEAASRIAAAVIAATPGMDAKSISAITTASSQGAADAPSVDTASGSANGVGSGSGNVANGPTSTQVQQLRAEQEKEKVDAKAKELTEKATKAEADAKAAREAEAAAKAALYAANEREYAKALEAYNKAVADRQAAETASNAATAAKVLAEQAAAAAASAAGAKTNASSTQAAAAVAADEAARAAAEAAKVAEAIAAALEKSKAAADSANTTIQGAASQKDAAIIANGVLADASSAFDQAKLDQAAAAAQAVAAQKAEAEATARASTATEAALAAAQLQAALNAATTKAQQDAAAEAARVAAAAANAAAATAANAATAAAASAQTASTSTFNNLSTENKNLANDYKSSNPAAAEPTTNSVKSVRSMFTQAQLADTSFAAFVAAWDDYIDKQQKKYAAIAAQVAKEAALLVAQQTEAAIKAAADITAAKAAAEAALTAANAAKVEQERLRQLAEDAAKIKSLEDARLQGEKAAAEIAKAAAAKLAADIAAANDATFKQKAADALAALETQRQAEAAKVQAAQDEAARLASLETAAAEEATRLAKVAADAAVLAAAQAAEAAAKAAAAAAAAAVVPPVVTPPTNPNATPTGANA
jgi:FecR protein